MIAFVNCRDRVTCTRALVSWLERQPNIRIILIDNASTYAPLLAFYRSTKHEVVRLPSNVGHTALWNAGVLPRYVSNVNERYLYSDPDVVPAESCPPDTLAHLSRILDRHPRLAKVGLGLRIDDLPDRCAIKPNVIRWEKKFWTQAIEAGVYRAQVDTTFALYRNPAVGYCHEPAARTGPPYVARHTPWYIDSAHLDEEERYYRAHARLDITSWNRAELAKHLR